MHRKTCKLCGSIFESIKKISKFCSRSCGAKNAISCRYNKVYEKPVQLFCLFCGNEYKVPNCRAEKSKFCSRICLNKSNGIIVSKTRQGENHPLWKGGKNNQVWIKRAKKLFPWCCSFCKSVKRIQVHHIDHNRLNNPFDGSNWKILCQTCHIKLHSKKINSKGQFS